MYIMYMYCILEYVNVMLYFVNVLANYLIPFYVCEYETKLLLKKGH